MTSFVYARPARSIVRLVEGSSGFSRIRRWIDRRGHGDVLERIGSDSPGRRALYAKLTILDATEHAGKDFRLSQDGTVVYGNRIKPPRSGDHVEYRNIIVSKRRAAALNVDIDAAYTLAFSHAPFVSPEQTRYDTKYGIRRAGGAWYSIRGNTESPRRIIVTFPGFPTTNSPVSYAVSYFKGLSDDHLSDSILIAFQDRYGVSGTYLLFDNEGRPLLKRIGRIIRDLMRKYHVSEGDVLFFGASKGASIAIMCAEAFSASRLVLVAPKMNLPYSFAKPVLRNSLYLDRRVWDVRQPESYIRQYFAEGRAIDWFYSDSDQESNFSTVEFARDVPNLTKYRIDGPHSAVTKKSMPTVLAILCDFSNGGDGGIAYVSDGVDQRLERDAEGFVTVSVSDVRLEGDSGAWNVFAERWLGSTLFRQLLSGRVGRGDFATSGQQKLDSAIHSGGPIKRYVSFGGLLGIRGYESIGSGMDLVPSEEISLPDRLRCDLVGLGTYAIRSSPDRHCTQIEYFATQGSDGSRSVEVIVVSRSELSCVAANCGAVGEGFAARFVVAAIDGWRDLAILVRRLAVEARADRASVVLLDRELPDEQVADVASLYGINIELFDPR